MPVPLSLATSIGLNDNSSLPKWSGYMSIALLRQAIKEKKQVTASYHGYPREFCPHILGLKNDEYRVLGYQFGGSSSQGPASGSWKCFIVSHLLLVTLREGPWHTEPSHFRERSQACIDTITAQVPF